MKGEKRKTFLGVRRSALALLPVLIGLSVVGWLFYREFTKANGVPGGTQLAVVHTHTLVLGTMMMLLWFLLVGVWPGLARRRSFRAGFWVWQAGLALTTGGMLVKGCLQVMANRIVLGKLFNCLPDHQAKIIQVVCLFIQIA